MFTDLQQKWIPRSLQKTLPQPSERTLVCLSGPRQAGKTSLAKKHYPDLRYVSLDSPENQDMVETIRSTAWAAQIGTAIIDEAQKAPVVFQKIKFAYDARAIHFSVLLGSAQLLLLGRISETLAGRILIYELWPLMLSELACRNKDVAQPPLLADLLDCRRSIGELLAPLPQKRTAGEDEDAAAALEHLSVYGGMPTLFEVRPDRRFHWLKSYVQTYLERDLADLARLADLRPFRLFQRLSALRAAQLLSYSEIARDAKLSAPTARNYIEYLKLSYQAFLLYPYHVNLTSTLVKSPKLYWSDIGVLRSLTGNTGPLSGPLFENMVVAEIMKWLRTSGHDTKPYFYRTRSGMEMDLLLETPAGLIGAEIKNREDGGPKDAGAMKKIAEVARSRWLGGLVITRGRRLAPIDEKLAIWEIPASRLLGPSDAFRSDPG